MRAGGSRCERHIDAIVHAGANGFAVIGAVLGAADLEAAARALAAVAPA